MKKKILHVITGLDTGGAEMMLYKLLKVLHSEKYQFHVLSLHTPGSCNLKIKELGIPISSLHCTHVWQVGKALAYYYFFLKKLNPHLIHGWLPHGNIVAQLGPYLTKGKIPTIWSIRQSLDHMKYEKKLTQWIIRIGAKLSPLASMITYNSHVGQKQHEEMGYGHKKSLFIPNGFDCIRFQPNEMIYQNLRKELKIPSESLLVGLIARFHPMKNHGNFLLAAERLIQHHPNLYCLLAGKEIDWNNEVFKHFPDRSRLFLLGEVKQTEKIMSALDVLCLSSSWGEGFPNVLGEAMSCGVPCVATDIGDSAWIIGETGFIVPPNDPDKLAEAIEKIITIPSEQRKMMGFKARQRIEENFSLPFIAKLYDNLYESCLN